MKTDSVDAISFCSCVDGRFFAFHSAFQGQMLLLLLHDFRIPSVVFRHHFQFIFLSFLFCCVRHSWVVDLCIVYVSAGRVIRYRRCCPVHFCRSITVLSLCAFISVWMNVTSSGFLPIVGSLLLLLWLSLSVPFHRWLLFSLSLSIFSSFGAQFKLSDLLRPFDLSFHFIFVSFYHFCFLVAIFGRCGNEEMASKSFSSDFVTFFFFCSFFRSSSDSFASCIYDFIRWTTDRRSVTHLTRQRNVRNRSFAFATFSCCFFFFYPCFRFSLFLRFCCLFSFTFYARSFFVRVFAFAMQWIMYEWHNQPYF